MKLPIIVAPDPRLRQVAKPVEKVDEETRALLEEMLEIMYEAPGIGLAAVQLGIPKRLVVMDIAGKDEPKAPMRLINPEIVWKSHETTVYEEGCLSIPNVYEDVERPAAVRARYQDETGATHEIEATGLLATCLQHEIDHLDGVLFVDYLSKLKRDMILRRLTKLKRQGVYSS